MTTGIAQRGHGSPRNRSLVRRMASRPSTSGALQAAASSFPRTSRRTAGVLWISQGARRVGAGAPTCSASKEAWQLPQPRQAARAMGSSLFEPHVEGGVAERTARAPTKAGNVLIASANGRPSRFVSCRATPASLAIAEGTAGQSGPGLRLPPRWCRRR